MSVAATTEPELSTDSVGRRRRTLWWFGGIGAAIVLVVGLVWVTGGFEPRTDVRTDVTPGTIVATGPYEFTFDRATVQKTRHFSEKRLVWEVVVYGSGRTTGDEAIAPSSLNWFMSARDPRSGILLQPTLQGFGPVESAVSGGAFFTPGLEPIPYRLTFQFSDDIPMPSSIDLAVWELELRDRSLLQTGELDWARTNHVSVYPAMPLQQLPDDLT